MEILDDDRPLPSSVSSCLQTHPPPHQEAHDFLSSLVSSWSPRGRAYGRGMGQSIRRERDCVLKLGPSILPGVPWSRRFLTSTFSMTPPCPGMVIPLAWQLLSKTLLLPKARVGLEPAVPPPYPMAGAPHVSGLAPLEISRYPFRKTSPPSLRRKRNGGVSSVIASSQGSPLRSPTPSGGRGLSRWPPSPYP